ncbi:MAG: hypothetical protein H7199_06740 [Burkholderiales bacterium]|nr:hypothetical protein [Flavobacterium sp.]
MEIYIQILWLFILAMPIACISWTVTHEEIFREPREYCISKSTSATSLLLRKFFYLFTCEYCFSHYTAIFFLFLTHYKLLMPGWRGYLISGFALIWLANIYMNVYALILQGIKKDKTAIKLMEKDSENKTET